MRQDVRSRPAQAAAESWRGIDATEIALSIITEAVKQVDALAFVGHSVLINEHPEWGSVGLNFFVDSIVKQMSPVQPYGQNGPAFTKVVPTIESAAKVIFIAACDTKDLFRSLWEINEASSGRALILPTDDRTDLYAASQAWRIIARSLSEGKTVGASVTDGNNLLASEGRTLRFTVIGDSNARLR